MLQAQLKQNRESVLRKWFDLTVSTYEPEMIRFLKKDKNPFSNPVRHTIRSGLEKIFDGIVNDMHIETCYEGLKEIIKLRAVQSFSPSQALVFIFDIKDIVRNELQDLINADISENEMRVFDKNVDRLTGVAFDIYSECREKINDIRLTEIKAKSQRAFNMLERRNKDL
jgi:hypothetical protein